MVGVRACGGGGVRVWGRRLVVCEYAEWLIHDGDESFLDRSSRATQHAMTYHSTVHFEAACLIWLANDAHLAKEGRLA